MKNFYNKYLYVSKHEKISDKVMLTRVIFTVTFMVMCLFAMSITAYAYFSYNVTSGSNIIKAANFEVGILIIDSENKEVPITENGEFKTADLKAENTYEVTLSYPTDENTAKTGFCVVYSDLCTDKFHTQQIDGEKKELTFYLTVTKDATVKFLSHWGTSSCYAEFAANGDGGKLYITDANIGEKAVKMEINNGVDSVSESKEEKEPTTDKTMAGGTESTEQTLPETETAGAPTTEASK